MHRVNTALLDTLRERIAAAEVVSFDVFDTLFLRLVASPEDVFDLVGARHGLPGFHKARIAAQTAAFKAMRAQGRREIDLDGIYACLPDLGVPAAVLKASEWEIELLVLRPNPQVMAVLDACRGMGKRCILLSDMYLPKAFFSELCARHGIAVERVFVSSDAQATKRDDGALFDFAARLLGVAPGAILHIGDNAESDIARGTERGVATALYRPPVPRPAASGPAESVVAGVAASAAYDPEHSPWWRHGYAAGGPASFALLRWLEERTRADGIDLLLLLSRDGFTLRALWPEGGVRSLYFKGSRVLFVLAAMTERNFEANIPFLLSGGRGLTLAELFGRIGVALPDESVLAGLGLSADTVFSRHNEREIEALLRVLRWRILRACIACRRGLHAQLLAAGIRDGMRIGLFDVGWRGSTQAAFERALKPLAEVSVKGYYLCLHEAPSDGSEREALLTPRVLPKGVLAALYANRVAVELFFSAPHGSVVGCDLDAAGEVAFREDPGRGADPRLPEIAAEIDAGIRACVADLAGLSEALPLALPPAALVAPLVALATAPSPEAADLVGSIYNFDSWGSSTRVRTYAARPDPGVRRLRGDAWPAGLAALERKG